MKINPSSTHAHYGLAKLIYTNKDLSENALWHFKFAAENDETNHKARLFIGNIYLDRGDFESAADYMKDCLNI
jgi:lipopolysaccharide biosynthesis regulator YciM